MKNERMMDGGNSVDLWEWCCLLTKLVNFDGAIINIDSNLPKKIKQPGCPTSEQSK